MGAEVNFSNHIEIAKRSVENGAIKMIGYCISVRISGSEFTGSMERTGLICPY